MEKKTSIETREGKKYLILTCHLSIPIGRKHFETIQFLDDELVSYFFDNLPGHKRWGTYQRYATAADRHAVDPLPCNGDLFRLKTGIKDWPLYRFEDNVVGSLKR